jgi:hypothetical protein
MRVGRHGGKLRALSQSHGAKTQITGES